MNEKQYLESIAKLLADHLTSTVAEASKDVDEYFALLVETERRLAALKAQEDNIKSDMWEEKK